MYNFLLLNSDKTEILLIGPKNSTQNLLDHNLQLDGCPTTSSKVRNLGVILDSNLSFENHISHVTKTAFFHLRNIAKPRNKHISLAKHLYNASHNLVLQLYLIKHTLLCFSLGWTNHFCLDGTTAMLIMSLFVSLFLPVTRNYTSFSLDPTLKWSEMTKHLRRDDANPSEDLRGSQPSDSIQN